MYGQPIYGQPVYGQPEYIQQQNFQQQPPVYERPPPQNIEMNQANHDDILIDGK
jgi:hypothetical protein